MVAAAGLQCCGLAHLVLNYIFDFYFFFFQIAIQYRDTY